MRFNPILSIVVAGVLAGPIPGLAQRQLYWRELEVEARLDAEGALSVSETHAMVFSGDWNGGERSFRVGLGQELSLEGVFRRDDSTGEWQRLERGNLDAVDHWDWSSGNTLRWRSRRPSDPEFDSTEIDYRIDYRLTGILRRDGDSWRIDHDFAFPDRVGEITRFVLDLDLDPAWQSLDLPSHLDEGPLPPGQGRVVEGRLRYVGSGSPVLAAPPHPPAAALWMAVAAGLLGVAGFLRWTYASERQLGRFAPLDPTAAMDRESLRDRVFSLAPEEVGAAWDDSVGAAEVAAMLARMQLEGKISSRVASEGWLIRRPNLHLTLRVPRAGLPLAERRLVDGLFPTGDETDTASLRKHYARSGFDPAKKIEKPLTDGLHRRPGFRAARRPRASRLPSVLLILGGLAALPLAIVLRPGSTPLAVLLFAAPAILWLPAFIAGMSTRNRVIAWRGPFVVAAAFLLAGCAALGAIGSLPGQSTVALAGAAAFLLGLARSVATAFRSRHVAETIAHRRELAAARGWFEDELARPAPQLEDSWAPYLIAFGLAPQMDRWWRTFGAAGAATGGHWGGSGSTGGGAWTGGGGAFGGAGATSSWALAATSMSSSVAAASSSGGGGGGGSSGGGGGGGW